MWRRRYTAVHQTCEELPESILTSNIDKVPWPVLLCPERSIHPLAGFLQKGLDWALVFCVVGPKRANLLVYIMESSSKAKRAPRTKKTPVVAADSVVSAFGGEVATATVAKTSNPNLSANANPAIFIEEVDEPVVPTPKAKKSTKRKPAVVASVTPEGIQGSLVTEQRPLIAHLPIHISDIDNDLFAPTPSAIVDTPAQPTPYDSEELLAVFGQEKIVTPVIPTPEMVDHVARPMLPLHYSERLMVRFQDANREQRLPDSTDVACFWDCHPFKGQPCVIPVGIEEGIWRVQGNFCCPECAAAFLFNERLDLHVQWERYALLNRLYAGGGDPVRLAPARSTLRLFGGALDVSDFRAILGDRRMRVDVMTPPMISIIQVMDTKPIDFYDASMKNTFIPWEMDRMNRPGAQGLRLRRTKPVAEKESTLEFCMGIVA